MLSQPSTVQAKPSYSEVPTGYWVGIPFLARFKSDFQLLDSITCREGKWGLLGKNIGDTYSFGVVMWSEVNKKREFCILGTRFFLSVLSKKLLHVFSNMVGGRDSIFWPDLGQIFSSQTVSHVGKENGDCWGRILGIHIVLEWLCSQRLTNQREFVSSGPRFFYLQCYLLQY